MSRLGLIVNPTSGKNTGARIGTEALTLLRAAGVDILDLSAADARSATEQARAAIDGGWVDRARRRRRRRHGAPRRSTCVAGTGVPLGIIAAGTGNDIARELGLPVRDAVKPPWSGSSPAAPAPMDVAAAPTTAAGEERWFLGVLAAGFDAVVNERANELALAQGPDALQPGDPARAARLPRHPVCVELDGTRLETEAMLVAVGNGPAYGGGMKVTPDASFDDGLLDVLVLHKISTAEFLRVFPRVFKGTHASHPRSRCCGPGPCAWRPPASSPTPTASASRRCR